MKISFLLTTGDTSAGTEHAIQSQILGLLQYGHEVSVHSVYHTNGRLRRSLPDDVKVTYWVDRNGLDLTGSISEEQAYRLSQEPSSLVPEAWDDQFTKLSDIICQYKIREIHEEIVVTTTPALAMLASYFLPTSTVIVAQEHRASMQRGIGITPLANVAHDLDAVISLNNENAEWIKDRFPESGFVNAVIPNSIPDTFRPRSSPESHVIMAAGRFAPGKQFDQLIEAFSIFKDDHPGWTLRLFGEGKGENKLRELVGNLNLHDSVEIITGVSDLTAEWAEAGIHAMTSRSEGQPLVILEASAAGVPTVAYDCPIGPRNMITHGKDGFLVPLNNVAAFAETLGDLASDVELRARMSLRSIETAKHYSPSRINEKWVRLYERLLRRRSPNDTRAEVNLAKIHHPVETPAETDTGVLLPRSHEMDSERAFSVPFVEPNELSADKSRSTNRCFVQAILRESGIPAVEIPTYGYYRSAFAIREEDRNAFVHSLAHSEEAGLCVRPMAGNSRLSKEDWHPSYDSLSDYLLSTANVFRIFFPVSDEVRRFTFGSVFAVDVEIWANSSDVYFPPRNNRGVDRLFEQDFLRGRVLLDASIWDDINFPIDVVYTWVDDSDEGWRQSKSEYETRELDSHPLASGSMRFKNRDELRYSVRSVRAFMPWVRNIYIVTADQFPQWLSEESDIRVVTHKQIFPDNSVLPVFNSHAIEASLHRIEGLSEHFLYMNDDTLLLRMQDPGTYFHANGTAKFFMSSVTIDTRSEDVEPHMWAAQNNRRILLQDFGKVITRGMLHTPHPHRKSVLERIESQYPQIFAAVRASRFRSPNDISLLSSFAQYYGYFVREYIPGSIRYAFCSRSDAKIEAKLSMLQRSERFDVVTFGEGESSIYTDEQLDHMVDQFLRSRFPYPSPDEIVLLSGGDSE
ncbi:stealth conserved region 3 domain-containing protein [Glutamicibacter sp. BSL13]